MPATHEISEGLIRENIARAVDDVFKTMIRRDARLRAAETKAFNDRLAPVSHAIPAPALAHVVGAVGFLGEVSGLIYLYLDEVFAKHCTAILLGMDEAETERIGDDDVNDAIGELTNMIVGSFKIGLCDAGYPCQLTIPSILRGRNFSVEPIGSTERHVYDFECQGERIVADILLKMENESLPCEIKF